MLVHTYTGQQTFPLHPVFYLLYYYYIGRQEMTVRWLNLEISSCMTLNQVNFCNCTEDNNSTIEHNYTIIIIIIITITIIISSSSSSQPLLSPLLHKQTNQWNIIKQRKHENKNLSLENCNSNNSQTQRQLPLATASHSKFSSSASSTDTVWRLNWSAASVAPSATDWDEPLLSAICRRSLPSQQSKHINTL